MKIFRTIYQTLKNVTSSIKRFPVTMISSLLASFSMAKALNFRSIDEGHVIYSRYGALFIAGIFIYTVIALGLEALIGQVENKEAKRAYYLSTFVAYALSLPLMYGLYEVIYSKDLGFFAYENKYIYFGMLGVFIVMASYIAKLSYHKDYVSYVSKIIDSFIIANIYSTVVFIGISAIIFALKSLFNIYFTDNIYMKIFYFIFLCFNVAIFLSNFPKTRESFNDSQFSKATRVLMLYIILPLILIYSAILLIYFLKILIIWQLPKGTIVNLVLWFSIFTVFYQFFAQKLEGKAILNFRRYYPYVLMPLLAMMFLAIIIRIREYGLTENRYFVIAGGTWVLISQIYYLTYRKNSNIFIPIILSGVILISCLGPISSYRLSFKNQANRLEKVLTKNGMLESGKIISKDDLSKEDRETIISTISYLRNNHRDKSLDYFSEGSLKDLEQMESSLGFELDNNYETKYNFYYLDENTLLDIEGYEKMTVIDSSAKESQISNYKIKFNSKTIEIFATEGEEKTLLQEIDLKALGDKLETLQKSNGTINPDDLSITGDFKGSKYKIIFRNIDMYYMEQSDIFINFYFLYNKED